MAYNTKPIITDVDGNPISQYYNKELDHFEPVEGQAGANKVVLYNADGTENNNLSLIPILEKLSQLTGTVIDEETRKSNELQRIELYNQISNMLETGQLKGEKGDKGDTGIGLNFLWQGTSLGVKLETDAEYVFVDLRGPQGPAGDIDNLTSQHIETALGYTPVKSVNNVVANEIGNVELDIDTSEIENRIGNVEDDLVVHKAEKATQTEYGHIRLQDIPLPAIATKEEAETGTNNTKMMTPLRTKQAIASNVQMSGAIVEININGEWVSFRRIIDINSWENVQQIVRNGWANDFFNIGDQLVSSYDGRTIVWEVIGIDVDTPADSQFTHSMTIQTKDCLHDIQFDAEEPNNLDSSRKSYGNNRYIHSAVRQWLNSDESTFTWESQHSYDAKPDNSLDLYNGAGFLHRLDPELVAVLGDVKKKVAQANVDGGKQDSFSDKVFLLSEKEVDFPGNGDMTGEFVYPFYRGKGDANRIKNLDVSPRYWWLRSPLVSDSRSVRYVHTSGDWGNNIARIAYGLSPACVII